MNTFLAQAISWFKSSPAVAEAKKEAVADLSQIAQNFMASVAKNSPDFVGQVEQHMTAALTTAIAGALTKK